MTKANLNIINNIVNNNKYLKIILREQCRRVDANFDDIDFNNENWYKEYNWTEEEENEFKKWLINYLKENKEARNQLMNIPTKEKSTLRRFANSFILFCG